MPRVEKAQIPKLQSNQIKKITLKDVKDALKKLDEKFGPQVVRNNNSIIFGIDETNLKILAYGNKKSLKNLN